MEFKQENINKIGINGDAVYFIIEEFDIDMFRTGEELQVIFYFCDENGEKIKNVEEDIFGTVYKQIALFFNQILKEHLGLRIKGV